MGDITDSPTVEAESFFTELQEGVSDPQDTTEEEQAELDATETQDSQPEEAEGQVEEGEEAAEYEETDSNEKEKSPKDDPDAFQHWQSRYQKAETKFSELGIKPEELPEEYVRVIKAFKDNPEALGQFADFMRGGERPTKGDSADKQESKGQIKKPVPPEKPANYDPYAAYQDPDSDSFKYQREFEQYLVDKAEFAEKKAEMTEQQLEADKQQRQQETEAQKQRRQWEQKLKAERGYDDDQVKDFFGFVEKATQGTFEPNEVVQLYEGFSGIKADGETNADVERKKAEVEKKKKTKRKHAPGPAVAGGAGNPGGKEADDKDSFFQKKTY